MVTVTGLPLRYRSNSRPWKLSGSSGGPVLTSSIDTPCGPLLDPTSSDLTSAVNFTFAIYASSFTRPSSVSHFLVIAKRATLPVRTECAGNSALQPCDARTLARRSCPDGIASAQARPPNAGAGPLVRNCTGLRFRLRSQVSSCGSPCLFESLTDGTLRACQQSSVQRPRPRSLAKVALSLLASVCAV